MLITTVIILILLPVFIFWSKVRLYLHIDTDKQSFFAYVKVLGIKIDIPPSKGSGKKRQKKAPQHFFNALSYLNIIKTEMLHVDIVLGTDDAAMTAMLTGNIKILMSMICLLLYKKADSTAFDIDISPDFENEAFSMRLDGIISASIINITLQTIKNIRRTAK